MKFYSTNNPAHIVSAKQAIMTGLAPDRGLYMPVEIPQLPASFFEALKEKKF